MQDEVSVDVADRHAAQDVVYWVEKIVGQAVSDAHRVINPVCGATHMQYVKIPAPKDAPFLGAPLPTKN